MHICCSNCAIYPVKTLKDEGHIITGLWFNPNIHPYQEYQNRLNALKKLQGMWNLSIEYIDYFPIPLPDASGEGVRGRVEDVFLGENKRCEYCYKVRLDETAKKAREIDAHAFTTTLLVSPYQKFDMIVDIGRMMQERYSVEFYGEDFRKGFSECKRLARELELYRQKYCGCIYSEMERYKKAVNSQKSNVLSR